MRKIIANVISKFTITKLLVALAAILLIVSMTYLGFFDKNQGVSPEVRAKMLARMQEYKRKEGAFLGLPGAEYLNRWFGNSN